MPVSISSNMPSVVPLHRPRSRDDDIFAEAADAVLSPMSANGGRDDDIFAQAVHSCTSRGKLYEATPVISEEPSPDSDNEYDESPDIGLSPSAVRLYHDSATALQRAARRSSMRRLSGYRAAAQMLREAEPTCREPPSRQLPLMVAAAAAAAIAYQALYHHILWSEGAAAPA